MLTQTNGLVMVRIIPYQIMLLT